MIGILIIAHGNLGQSLIDCATHVMGSPQVNLAQIGIETCDDPANILSRAKQLVQSLDDGTGVLVLSDMYGATPCNVVGRLVKPGQIEGVSGVNLPMLVRALSYRNQTIAEVTEKALSGGHQGVMHFTNEACQDKQ